MTRSVRTTGGLNCLYQSSGGSDRDDNEVLVPPCEAYVLYLSHYGTPLLDSRVDNKPYRVSLSAWDGGFLPQGVEAWFSARGSAARNVFHLHLKSGYLAMLAEVEGLERALQRLEPRVFGLPEDIRDLGKTLYTAQARGETSELYWTSAANMLGIRLLRHGADSPPPPRGGLAPWQVARVCDYVQDHLSEEIALETLAALVDLSPHHFCRAFKASTGAPPHRWQLEARVRRAEVLMRDRRAGLADIAIACGFFDQSHFTRVFQRFRSVSPGRWRRGIA